MKKRLIFITILVVLISSGLSYFRYGTITIKRVMLESVTGPILDLFGVPASPARRLARADLMVQEQQVMLQHKMEQLAADIATSDEFQQYLENLVTELEKTNPKAETDVFLAKLKLFRAYRQKWQQLAELQQKIEQGIALAQMAEVTTSTELVNEIVRQVETELRLFRLETSESLLPIPLSTPVPTATPTLSTNSPTTTITATITFESRQQQSPDVPSLIEE